MTQPFIHFLTHAQSAGNNIGTRIWHFVMMLPAIPAFSFRLLEARTKKVTLQTRLPGANLGAMELIASNVDDEPLTTMPLARAKMIAQNMPILFIVLDVLIFAQTATYTRLSQNRNVISG